VIPKPPFDTPQDAVPFGTRATLLGHDIRNTVTDILGGLALTDIGPLDAASKNQVQRVRSASEQLARLCDEVLALITGETAPETGQGEAFEFRQFLASTNARWSAHAAEKDLSFSLETSTDLPPVIGTDRGALERILANLIGNAMKHTETGEVALSVGMRARETLCLTVRDTGPGFSDGALARLFELGGRPADTGPPGSGLGLHIVHDLAARIGARIDVGNHSLGGARVAVLLPRAAWAPGPKSAVGSGEPLPDLSGKCVLVAEDNSTNQLLMRQMLETLGADCKIASDGQEALGYLQHKYFDLALIDIEMPRLSGLDLIRILRAREAAHACTPLPVLAITAYVLSANREEIYDSGADGILAKPSMSIESFGQAIGTVLAVRGSTDQLLPTSDATAPLLDKLQLDRLLALAGEANGRELLSRLRQDFATVQSGVQTGLHDPDFALLRARSHVLISLAGAIGSVRLQHMAEALNSAAHNRDHTQTHVIGPQVIAEIDAVETCLSNEYRTLFGEQPA